MKRLCFDDTLLSFFFCSLVAVLGCVGIAAWQPPTMDGAAPPPPAASASEPLLASR